MADVALPTVTLGEFLERLSGVKKAGSRWSARCPAHDDRTPSLTVSQGRDGVLAKCHAGCSFDAIVAGAGLEPSQLFAPRADRVVSRTSSTSPASNGHGRNGAHSRLGDLTLVEQYTYTDADGLPLFQTRRYVPKTFRQFRFENEHWIAGLGEVEPVLFNLPAVIEAVAMGRRVVIVEGEKDAVALTALGVIATTSPMGAGKWRDSMSEVFRDAADVVILPDNDDAGRNHAMLVANSLAAHGATALIVQLPRLKAKQDVSDWLASGGSEAELEMLIRSAERVARGSWEPDDGREMVMPPRFRLLSIEEVEQIPAPTFLVEDIIPDASACELHGPPGGGKTFAALDLALSVASGRNFFGHKVRQGPVVYVIGEGQSGMGIRIRAWKAARGVWGDIRFKVVPSAVQLLEPLDVQLFVNTLLAGLDVAPVLIVLDTLARCFVGGEENLARDMGIAIATVDALRQRTGAAVLLVHHTRVDGDRERGSNTLRGGVDTMLSISGDEQRMTLVCEKQKDARPFGEITFHLVESLQSMVLQLPGRVEPGPSRKAMAVLEVLVRDFPETSPSTTEWKDAAEAPKTSFWRSTGELLRANYVVMTEKGASKRWTATPDGRIAVALIGKTLETRGAK